ncbi:MAG TPA: hypothetical protein VNI34_06770 [Candidatus Nitrosotalea sp.]|nr:hypothetical protein [Candidatus Nitrosotalea sp.]
MTEPDAGALRLVQDREDARRRRDWAQADQIRAELAALGWDAVDSADGTSLRSRLNRVENPDGRPSQLGSDDLYDFSLLIVLYGWPEDVRRLLAALAGLKSSLEAVVVDLCEAGCEPEQVFDPAPQRSLRFLRSARPAGHGAALNAALHQARGRIVAFTEPSLEFGPRVLEECEGALRDPKVGLAGPFGLQNFDQHHFEPALGPSADALEYLLAFRRRDAALLGDVDPRFRYYRNFDLDYSYQARAAGLGLAVTPSEGITRHTHRVYAATPEPERERLSRRNFNLWMDHWVRR